MEGISMIQECRLELAPRLRITYEFKCHACGATPMFEQLGVIVTTYNHYLYYCPSCKARIYWKDRNEVEIDD